MEIKNMFPVFEKGIMPSITGAISPESWFSEFILISFLLPYLTDREKGMKWGMISVFLVMLITLITNIATLLVLGNITGDLTYPVMTAVRYISIADFLEHVEAIVMAIWVSGAFVKISVFYYALALGTAQWLNLSDYRPIVFPLGFLLALFAIWSAPNLQEFPHFLTTSSPFYLLSIQTLIPLILLLIAFIRKGRNMRSKWKEYETGGVSGMIRILLFIPIISIILLISGCWDRKEINYQGFVAGASLDKKSEKQIEVAVQIYIPSTLSGGGGATGSAGGSGGGAAHTLLRSATGSNIADALLKLQEKLPRHIFWGHAKVIVIGEKLAKEGIREQLDFLLRHPQPRLRSYVFVSKGSAKDTLALIPPLERSSSEVLRELAKSEIMMDTTLRDFLQMLKGDAQAAALPMVEILPPSKGQEPLQSMAYINSTAVFKKGRMIGRIDDKLTRGVLWFQNKIKYAHITIRAREGKGEITTKMLHTNTELIPKIEDGKWRITVKGETENDIILNASNLNLMNPKFIKELEQESAKDIQQRMEQTLQKVQNEMKTDILGFSEAFHQKYPKKWQGMTKKWDDIFPTVEVTYNIKANIRRPGMSTNPQGLPEDEVKKK